MGVYSNTVSVMQYDVAGDLPAENIFEWISSKLSGRSFESIEESAEEESHGWVRLDDMEDSSFDVPAAFWRDRYAVFSMRHDRRRIPAPLFKSHLARREEDFLSTRPDMKRVPKGQREELKELVQQRLLARSLPVPSAVDAVWCPETSNLLLFSLGNSSVTRFEDLFSKTFEGLHLMPVFPLSRARRMLSGQLLDLLEGANQAASEAVLAQIRDNRWIGEDFLLWLLHRGISGESDYAVCRPGTFGAGEAFTAWIDDRIVLECGGDAGTQKVSVSGSQDSYLEARSALRSGKRITSATLYMEKNEEQWKMTLRGEMFAFASFRCPPVQLEKDAVTEAESEREAVFYERMFLMEQGLQMFDSILCAFLDERLGVRWGERMKTVNEWLEGA